MANVPPGREESSHCFVCGPKNPIGLQVDFRLDEQGRCLAEFTPTAAHCGFQGVTHGGLLYALLDDVMANGLWLRGEQGFTARCEVRYRQPLPVGTPVALIGVLGRRRGRMVQTEGEIRRRDRDEIVATATASFMIGLPD